MRRIKLRETKKYMKRNFASLYSHSPNSSFIKSKRYEGPGINHTQQQTRQVLLKKPHGKEPWKTKTWMES